jgi:hypothetical protein
VSNPTIATQSNGNSWGLLMDEAAFQPEAGEAYDAAVPVCQKIIVVSSAGPGWFADFVTEAM